jgi:hypothetical protein
MKLKNLAVVRLVLVGAVGAVISFYGFGCDLATWTRRQVRRYIWCRYVIKGYG